MSVQSLRNSLKNFQVYILNLFFFTHCIEKQHNDLHACYMIIANYTCIYLHVLDCDDDVIQEWQKEEVEALKPKEHGSFIPQHLLTIIRENSFFCIH